MNHTAQPSVILTAATTWLTIENLREETGFHSDISRAAPYCIVQPEGYLYYLPLSSCSISLHPGDHRGPGLPLCLSQSLVFSHLSEKGPEMDYIHYRRWEQLSGGTSVFNFCISKNVPHCEKCEENEKEDVQRCSLPSLMKENVGSCLFLSPTAPSQPDYCLMMMALPPDVQLE